MRWSDQRTIASSKIVKSSAVWLVVVPIAAKSLSSINETIDLQILGETVKFTTTLPFSWQILFFAACAFTFAGIVYSIFCPYIVKNYKNFTEYEAEGKSRLQINCSLKTLVLQRNNLNHKFKEEAKIYLERYTKIEESNLIELTINEVVDTNEEADDFIDVLDNTDFNKGKNSNAFYYVYNIANSYNYAAMVVSYIFYIIGFILLLILSVQNIYYVYNTMMW